MGKFTGWLMLEYINGREWIVINEHPETPFGYILSDGSHVIPGNRFKTDFGTIPFVFWSIFPPVGTGSRSAYGKACVIHDWLYMIKEHNGEKINRRKADTIFLNAMKDSGVSLWRRTIMYTAVRGFGWVYWNGWVE